MLYNMLTGIPPFFEMNEASTRMQIKSGVFSIEYPNYVKSVSSEAKDLVSKMLQIASGLRISSSEAISHPWLAS